MDELNVDATMEDNFIGQSEKIATLEQDNARLRSMNESARVTLEEGTETIESLVAEVERLREALEELRKGTACYLRRASRSVGYMVDEYESMYKRLELYRQVTQGLVEYRKRNTLNFQLEKADYWINQLATLAPTDQDDPDPQEVAGLG